MAHKLGKSPWFPLQFLLPRGHFCSGIGLWSSCVASPICQEGQSERTFPIYPLFPNFPLFFPIFCDVLPLFSDFWQIFRSQGGHSGLLTPSGYATALEALVSTLKNMKFTKTNKNLIYSVHLVFVSPLVPKMALGSMLKLVNQGPISLFLFLIFTLGCNSAIE